MIFFTLLKRVISATLTLTTHCQWLTLKLTKSYNKLETDTSTLDKWLTNNGMLLNEDKCQFLIIESSGVLRNENASASVGSKKITECNKGKLLGITFDRNIIMAEHIQNMCKQVSNKLHALARISTFFK